MTCHQQLRARFGQAARRHGSTPGCQGQAARRSRNTQKHPEGIQPRHRSRAAFIAPLAPPHRRWRGAAAADVSEVVDAHEGVVATQRKKAGRRDVERRGAMKAYGYLVTILLTVAKAPCGIGRMGNQSRNWSNDETLPPKPKTRRP